MIPSPYQRDSLQALLGLFLQAQGYPLLQHSKAKSASALSRFLNVYPWSTRRVIRTVRRVTLEQILSQSRLGRRPILQVIIAGIHRLQGLPKALTQRFEVLILADTAMVRSEFLQGVRNLRQHAIVGVRCDLQLEDGRSVTGNAVR